MPDGFPNKPKILRGAFVEYGLSIPPLFVVFQFNPEQLNRGRGLSYAAPTSAQTRGKPNALRDFHMQFNDLTDLQATQEVTISEEVISFELRLDATDDLDEGNLVTQKLGIAPRLSTLELMIQPKEESLLGLPLRSILGSSCGYSFTRQPNPPMILFIWGRKRVLPVNITSLNITELFHDTELNPIRATASVSLTVIEGRSRQYIYSKLSKESESLFNLTNRGELYNIVVPG